MTALHLFDTYERRVREFTPLNDNGVGLYCCGPTVYHSAHIGNLRTYVFEDLLRRKPDRFQTSHLNVVARAASYGSVRRTAYGSYRQKKAPT